MLKDLKELLINQLSDIAAFETDEISLPAGIIAVVIFVTVTGMALTARFLYRRKETYRNTNVKEVQREDSPDFPFNNQTDSQNVSSENPKEYFIWLRCDDLINCWILELKVSLSMPQETALRANLRDTSSEAVALTHAEGKKEQFSVVFLLLYRKLWIHWHKQATMLDFRVFISLFLL